MGVTAELGGREVVMEDIQALDFDIPCELPDPDEHAAVFVHACKFCPWSEFVCLKHMLYVRQSIDSWLAASPAHWVFCNGCDKKARSWAELRTVVAL